MIDDTYPTDKELGYIGTYDPLKHDNSFLLLAKFVTSIWWYPESSEIRGKRWTCSTCGWSGNEDIIAALKKNYIFWSLCFKSERAGGHFEFELVEIKKSRN